MTFSNGDVPMVNDATNGIAPTSYELFHYGQRLGIDPEVIPLEDSGYRMIREGNYELLVEYRQPQETYLKELGLTQIALGARVQVLVKKK